MNTSRMEPAGSGDPLSRADVETAFDTIGEAAQQQHDKEQADERQDAARRLKALAIAGLIALLVALPASIGSGILTLQVRGEQIAAELDADQRREVTARAAAQLDDINRRLTAQGKAPVALPAPGEDTTDAIARVVLAQVLADPQLAASPNAGQVGDAIAGRVTDNLLGTTRSQVVESATAYLAANPPAPGRPPSEGEIQAAVDAAYAARPPAPGRPGDPGVNGVNGTNGRDGAPGAPGRGQVGSAQDPNDPCTRIVRFNQPPLEERWNTCPAAAPPPDVGTTAPAPTTTD